MTGATWEEPGESQPVRFKSQICDMEALFSAALHWYKKQHKYAFCTAEEHMQAMKD